MGRKQLVDRLNPQPKAVTNAHAGALGGMTAFALVKSAQRVKCDLQRVVSLFCH